MARSSRRYGQASRRRPTASGTVRSSTWISRLFFLLGLFSALAIALGFWWFGNQVAALKEPITIARADGAAALTGGSDARLQAGVKLLEAATIPRLLISGVNHVSTSEQIRLVAGGKAETFACCVDLGRDAVDTVGNAREVAVWVKRHRVKRLILITENYHMPRSLFEMRRTIPDVTIVPYPVATELYTNGEWWTSERATRGLALEYSKYLVARARAIWSDLPWVGST